MKSLILHQLAGNYKVDRLYHAVPQNDTTIEGMAGGVPGVRSFGLNTNQPTNFSGATTDSSGNVSIPGSLTVLGSRKGGTANIISGQGATRTLLASESTSVALFDRAAGIIYTLPAPQPGLSFTFIVTTSITSNNAKVITDAGTTLLIGDIDVASTSPTTTTFFGNGTSHISVLQNGTTTGGLIGSYIECRCVTSTVWNVFGAIQGSGTLATPFSTS